LRGAPADRAGRPFSDHDLADEHPLTVLARQLVLAAALRAAAPGMVVIGSGFSWLRHHLPTVAAAAVGAGWSTSPGSAAPRSPPRTSPRRS
jgi:hypothetical protein